MTTARLGRFSELLFMPLLVLGLILMVPSQAGAFEYRGFYLGMSKSAALDNALVQGLTLVAPNPDHPYYVVLEGAEIPISMTFCDHNLDSIGSTGKGSYTSYRSMFEDAMARYGNSLTLEDQIKGNTYFRSDMWKAVDHVFVLDLVELNAHGGTLILITSSVSYEYPVTCDGR